MLPIPLSSSSLLAVSYDEAAQTLQLQFRSGAIYEYFAVPAEILQGLLVAPSHGQFFNRHIRSRFSHRRLQAAQT